MAGRIRSFKPEMMEDEETAGLSATAFRLFVGILLLADDHGNLRASPGWIRGQVFHTAKVSDKVFDAAFAEVTRKLVALYEVGGQQYAHVQKWAKHQRIDNAVAPRVPIPPGWTCEEEIRTEGGRTRRRWVSAGPELSANPPANINGGAAPPAPSQPVVPQFAAGSRSPIPIPTTEAGAPPARRRASPPRLPPDHWLTVGLAASPMLAGCDHGALAAVAESQAKASGRTDDEIQSAAEEAIAILGRAYNSAAGVGDPGAYVAETLTRLLKPGGLEVRQSETAPRDAASGTQRAARASPVHPGRLDPESEPERRQGLRALAERERERRTGTDGGAK